MAVKDFMPLTFEPDVRFNAVTNATYLWADVEGGVHK